MSENYCPSCGLQKIYGRTLAYYPDGPDLNKNICSKCGQTLISADATIATLQRWNAQLRAALETLVQSAEAVDKAWHYEASQGDGIMEEHAPVDEAIVLALNDARAVLAQTPTETLARWNAMARVCEAAEKRTLAHDNAPGTPYGVEDTPELEEADFELAAALAALRSLDTKAGG